MKLAAAAYPLTWFDSWSDYEAKLTAWVGKGAGTGADLLVFPEYAALELASLGGAAVAADQDGVLHEAARHRAAADALHLQLAAQFGVHILGGSGPVWTGGTRPVNRATLFGPGGMLGHQDKQMMTRFEAEDWDVRPGNALQVFATPFARLGVVICYDSEFPLLSRTLVEAGAELLLAPSCTETPAGYTRVRVGSMARALENQCPVIHAPLIGLAPWCAGVEENHGRAAIYGPADEGWPADGILAEAPMDTPGWVVAEVDRALISRTRAEGVVLTHRDWPAQVARAAQTVESAG